jgi:hypothetical protein
MVRAGSVSRSSSKPSVSKPSYTSRTYTPSIPTTHSVKIEQPGVFSNMWSGFGLGAGQAIAHNIFRSTPAVPTVPVTPVVQTDHREFEQCMKDSGNDMEACRKLLK